MFYSFSKLVSNVLHFFLLGIYLKDTILNVLKKFKIDLNQVYTITSDNGANMLKAIDLFENEISKNNDLEVDEPVYELINDDSDTTSTSDDNNDNNR